MSPERVPSAPGEELLALALSRPDDALVAVGALLRSRPAPAAGSFAHQAAAIVLRDRGDLVAAGAHLRKALALARSSGRTEREADVRATFAVTLILKGRTRQGLAELETAVHLAEATGGSDAVGSGEPSPAPALLGRILYRRAAVLWELGRYGDVSGDLAVALPVLRRAGDDVWLARGLSLRAHLAMFSGATSRAAADFALAEELFQQTGQEYEYAMSRHNRGLAAIAQGDLPLALTRFEEAEQRYAAVGTRPAELALDRSAALLAAGLAQDARQAAEVGARRAAHRGGPAKRAELLYAAAAAALAVPDLPAAITLAQQAGRMFRAQGRELWLARSRLVLASARYASGRRTGGLLQAIAASASTLENLDAEQALRAQLLAGRLALDLGRQDAAADHLGRAARLRRSAPPLVRSLTWLARALWAEWRQDSRAALAASRSGLQALQEHQLTLGSTELRAYATAHGAELALIAQRQALAGRHRARRLLVASERWRATVQALPVQGNNALGQDGELRPLLTALRAVARELEVVREAGLDVARFDATRPDPARPDGSRSEASPAVVLDRERRRLENEIRQRTLRRSGGASVLSTRPFDVDAVAAALAGAALVELVEVDGVLHALTLTVSGGSTRIREHPLEGPPVTLVEHARFLLRRAAHGRAGAGLEGLLDEIGRRLQDGLLGPAAADLAGDGPVVVIPPGPLQAVPWALLPVLRDRVLSVSPSASGWLRATTLPAPLTRRVTFVAGPGLGSGAGEIAALARDYAQHAQLTVLTGDQAGAEVTLAALDGAWLAHLAAHGSLRLDNPLFSALHLADGPLTVHDFERLERAPYRLILPCCNSGVGSPVGADELLGLVSSLMPLGAAGVLASVVPINDAATVPLMLALHGALHAGKGLPEALLSARRATAEDPIALATGYSFTAFGI